MSNDQGSHRATEATIPLHDADSIGKGDASIGELVKNASTHVSTLMRSELELAKTEVMEQVKRAATGSGFFVGALVFLAMSFFPFVFMWAKLFSLWLGTKTWDWAGFLIVFLLLVLFAVICGLLGYAKVKKIQKPQRTIDSVSDLKLAVPTTTAREASSTTQTPVRSVRH